MDGAPLEAPAEKAERGVCCMIALRQLVPLCSADPESEPVVVLDGVAAHVELPAGTLLHHFGGSAAGVEESDMVVQQQQRLTDFSEVAMNVKVVFMPPWSFRMDNH
jgi:hypothetical protein